jgi:hypothetical protein
VASTSERMEGSRFGAGKLGVAPFAIGAVNKRRGKNRRLPGITQRFPSILGTFPESTPTPRSGVETILVQSTNTRILHHPIGDGIFEDEDDDENEDESEAPDRDGTNRWIGPGNRLLETHRVSHL